jgi:DNA invertase Pin-like site-specific DNA recombinase
LQVEQLEKYGCTKIFHEKKSGKNPGRPELNKAMEYLRAGDKLAVYKIDRLARSTRDLHNIVHELQEKNIGDVFSKEQIDFSTPDRRLMFAMSGLLVNSSAISSMNGQKKGENGRKHKGNTKEERDRTQR